MGNWMDMARGYGWINNQLTGTWKPNGAKNGRVRTGLGSFRSNLNQAPAAEPVKAPVTKPVKASNKTPSKSKSRFAWLKPSGKNKPSSETAPASKVTTPSSKKSTSLRTPKELRDLKPPPGVRAIRRVPTRVHR